MASASGLLWLAAALAASCSALPCAVQCPPAGQQQAAWQVLLLPPNGIIVLVPGHVHLCPGQRFTVEAPPLLAPLLDAEVAITETAVPNGLGNAKTREAGDVADWKLLSFIYAPDRPCGEGQRRDDRGKCREAWPASRR